ncbi:MAG TPA: PA domain-containing protein, partial [Candidatus Acidoferrales bacterium]|nr:PA domain-containing protein [Candidatus Acidoferrales bacterium]
MRKLILFLIAALLGAQTDRSRIAEGFDSINAARLKADLTFLSSDALEGRRSLERGDEVAVQWIASEFAKAGLKPLVGDSYLQPVPLIEYQVDRQETTLNVSRGSGSIGYRAPDVTCNFPNEGGFGGEVVFAGYGISAPELGYDDYAGIDAKGKVVLIFNHEPQENDAQSIFNGTGNTRYTNNYSKTLNAQRHGAVAVLTMVEPSHAADGGRGGRGPQQTAASARIPPQALAEGGTAIPLVTISAAIGNHFFNMAGKKADDVQKAIEAKLSPMSFAVPNTRVFLNEVVAERKRANSYNVVGLLPGSDPTL